MPLISLPTLVVKFFWLLAAVVGMVLAVRRIGVAGRMDDAVLARRCCLTQWSSGWATKTREQKATRPKSSGRQVAGDDAQCGGQPGGPDDSARPAVT